MKFVSVVACVYAHVCCLCVYVGSVPTFGIDIPFKVPEIPNPLNGLFQNKCMEDLGCFYTGPPFFHPIYRPISLTPTDKENLKTRFLLFTRINNETAQEILPNEESVKNSSLDSRWETKVLIHGFLTEMSEDDIRFKMKDELLRLRDYNVIVVDWSGNNGNPYPQAVANARAVAAQLAQLLNFLIRERDVKPQSIHLIGHSLGGHISGWAGERIPTLGRITGLDPAGPMFQEAPNDVRLDATDASFVDVIHTDGGENVVDGLGIGDPVGHIDFYPNGGRRQPGCFYASKRNTATGAVVNASTHLLSNRCDHGRANEYYLESIPEGGCKFLAVECDSYLSFERGLCSEENSTIAEMGFRATPFPALEENTKFFLRTGRESPFCIENGIRI